MVAHQITVIRGEHHHRIVGDAGFFQCGQDAGHGVVDHGDHAVGQCHDLLDFTGVGGEHAWRLQLRPAVGAFALQPLQMSAEAL